MKQENIYDQLASEEFVASQAKFQQEFQQIRVGLDRDLGMGSNLQDSSGLVNPLGLKEHQSLYGQKGAITGAGQPPNFGRREQVNLGEEDFNQLAPSARNLRESSDLTLDMLQGKDAMGGQRFNANMAPNQLAALANAANMPRNYSQSGVAGPAKEASLDGGFSIEQFRQNNAQLSEIMMQLQMPTMQAQQMSQQQQMKAQMPSQRLTQHRPSVDEKFKQLSSAPTAGYSGSNPSTKLNSHGVQSEVSQFNYGGNLEDGLGELPAISQPILTQAPSTNTANYSNYNYGPTSDMPPSAGQYMTGAYGQQLQQSKYQTASETVDPNLPSRSTSPIGLGLPQQQTQQQPQLENHSRQQMFKPNSAFQTAGQSIVDHKENMNVHNTIGTSNIADQNLQGQRGPSPGLMQSRHHVSQVELLSQLQQSSSQGSALQQSSINHNTNNPYAAGAWNNQMRSKQVYGAAAGLSNQASQPTLAGEFTLQPRQPGQQPESTAPAATKSQLSLHAPGEVQVQKQHNQIMMNFDDIPISKIQKMPGYQTGDLDVQGDTYNNPEASQGVSPAGGLAGTLEDEEAQSKPLSDRAKDQKWSIRLAAYKEINNAFYNDYAQFSASKSGQAGPAGDPELMASFEQYGPLLDKMIMDQNTIAALEGLQVMHTYIKLALDIKNVTFAAHNYLIEKAPTNKDKFRDICLKIVLVMLERGQASYLYPELIKRVRSQQQKIASFSSLVINEALKTSTATEDINLKNVFRMIQDNLSQKNKELRETAMQILQHIYTRCGDDAPTFIANCKNLRPVQAKEIQLVLAKLEKSTKAAHQAQLFDSNHGGNAVNDLSGNARDAKDGEGAARHGNAATSNFEAPQRDINGVSAVTNEKEPVDLLTLIPDNFSEIPYLTQISVKKRSMESFNSELVKLQASSTGPGSVPIKNRDYTVIFNTVIHMLEDKNMLVFLEGIKTVELLANLIGPLNYLKQAKVKLWLGLLAGKYGETKTAVIAAVDKTMLAIVKYAYNQVHFVAECINTIVSTHKNPRVKQFVIEHSIGPFINSISSEKELVGNMFRVIKEKLVQLILKDTSAACRDASVSLLVTFKLIIPENALVEQAITALPKYRVSEIQKRINPEQPEGFSDVPTSDKQAQHANTVQPSKRQKAESAIVDAQNGAQTTSAGAATEEFEENARPKFAKSLTQRINSAKQQAVQQQQQDPNQNTLHSMQSSFVEEVLRGGATFVSHETKLPLTEILYDLGTMKANRFTDLYDGATMEQKWDACLRQMGELGVRECKALIISAIYRVMTTPKILLYENQQSLKSLLNLGKRLLVLERSILRDDDGKSCELQEYMKISLLQNVWIANNQGETCQMLQIALIATSNAFEFTEQLREVAEQPLILQCPAALQIIEAVYVWLGIRLNDLLGAGMTLSDLDMLRGFGIKYLDGAGFSEPQRQALISIMIKFKDLVQFKRDEIERNENPATEETKIMPQVHHEELEKELPSVSQLSRQHTPHITADSDEARLQSSQISHPQTAAFAKESLMQESVGVPTPRGEVNGPILDDSEMTAENVCRLIDVEFEKGLLLFKDMAQQQTLEFKIKQQIFDKLLSIVNESYNKTNPQTQYKQAYALKALMWMKEETLGIEDSYRLTQKVMSVFASADVAELDSTVELYLLNFWTKDLSIRDLADRLGLCVLNAASGNIDESAYQTGYAASLTAKNCTNVQKGTFNSLMQWFSDKRLFPEGEVEPEDEDDWLVSDLRKIVFYLTVSVLDHKVSSSQNARTFLKKIVDRFGLERVKEFMEIQLMHHSELSLQLLDWLDSTSQSRVMQTESEHGRNLHHERDSIISVAPMQQTLDDEEESRNNLPTMPKVNLEEMSSRNAKQDQQSHASIGGDSSLSKPGSRQTPRGLTGASQSYKERRDQYKMKSNLKARESMAAAAQPEVQALDQSSNSHSEIITRIEQNLSAAPSATNLALNDRDHQIEEASGESDDKEHEMKRAAVSQFEENREVGDDQPFRTTNTSAYYRSMEKKRRRYTPSAEELADDQDIRGVSSDEDDATVNQQEPKKEVVIYQEHQEWEQNEVQQLETQSNGRERVHEIENRLELSNIKGRHINDKIQMLEFDKERIEQQSQLLKQQKDEQSQEWSEKVQSMEYEHAKVVQNLSSVNQQYSAQVHENEQLKRELQKMQMQHVEMMGRFEQIEKKLEEDRNRAISPMKAAGSGALRESTAKKEIVVSVQKIQRIEDTFSTGRALTDGSQEEIMQMISRIQRLLLGVEKNVEGELAKPLIIHYTKLRMLDQRMQMIEALHSALDQNEDVLTALSALVYKALLNYLLWAFAHEKQILENTSITAHGQQNDQNEVTLLSQQLVSKLLNSKRFTTSLVCLFQLLREAMPNDIAADLSIEERQYLRVVMRCIQRISRALHSEQADMVRAFDVLLEMQKMFEKHPPELLREDLPCLADFDFIYRGMKDVSDKLIELQPEKVESFLSYAVAAENESQNAFIKYLMQMLSQQR